MDEKTKKFIERASIKHNNKYSYPNAVYIKAIEKIKINCSIHGEFLQAPNEHLKGRGCIECGRHSAKKIMTKSNTDFITKANKIHNNKYTYCLDEYKNNRSKIKINCSTHGEFLQRASSHLAGYGCPNCSYDSLKYTNSEFIYEANKIHNNKYDYSKTNYNSSHESVTITCIEHGDFKQKAYIHLSGKGCNKCAIKKRIYNLEQNENNFSKSGYKSIANGRECTFYILHCYNNEEEFYKIGITVNTVKQRYFCKKTMPYEYKILKEIKGDSETIWTTENLLKNKLTKKYKPKIKFSGSVRECYTDINEINTVLNELSKC